MCDKFICKLYIQKSKNVLLRSVENVFNQMYKYLASKSQLQKNWEQNIRVNYIKVHTYK